MSIKEIPSWQPTEEDLGWGDPYIFTPKQAKSLIVRLHLLDGQAGITDRQAIEAVFTPELQSGFETFDSLRTLTNTASKAGLKKIGQAFSKVAENRGVNPAAAVFPLSQEEIAGLNITADTTPNSFTLYQRLNGSFAGKTFKDIEEALEAWKKQKKTVTPPVRTNVVFQPPAKVAPTPAPIIQPAPTTVEVYKVPEKTKVTDEVQEVINQLTKTAGPILSKAPRDQVADLASLVMRFQSDSITPPDPMAFLETHKYADKLQLATLALQKAIVDLVNLEAAARSQWRTGRAINNLTFFLGQANGEQIVRESLLALPDVQVRILSEAMSTSMKGRLGYPDIDWCDEAQMSRYLVQASSFRPSPESPDPDTYERNFIPDENVERLGIILYTCAERINQDLNASVIIASIIEERGEDYASAVFTRMVKIAKKGDFLDRLGYFFQQDSTTGLFARKCARLLIRGT